MSDRRAEAPVTIVTGAVGGIGWATCARLAEVGARVTVVDRDEAQVAQVVRDLCGRHDAGPANPIALGMASDVRSAGDMQRMAERTVARFGRIDALVACAGILRAPGGAPKPVARMSAFEWTEVVATNLTGVFLAARAVLPPMIERNCGHVITVSSISGRQGRALDSAYCASKFGVVALSRALAKEVAGYGVRVSTVLPGAVATPLWDQNGPLRAPAGALAPRRVADLIATLLALPADTLLVEPVIVPSGRPGAGAPVPRSRQGARRPAAAPSRPSPQA